MWAEVAPLDLVPRVRDRMDRLVPRAIACFGLSIVAVVLVWAGNEVWLAGRDIGAQQMVFATEYLLGAQLLWMLSGAVGAGIIAIASWTTEASPGALLAASIVPLLVVVPMYVWTNPDLPSWLHQITPTPDWLVSPYVQTAAPVLAGVLLGSALGRSIRAFTQTRSDQRDQQVT